MIKVDNGCMSIRGTKIEILADITSLIHQLYMDKDIDEGDVDDIARLAKMDEDELQAELEERKAEREFMRDFAKMLNDLAKEAGITAKDLKGEI